MSKENTCETPKSILLREPPAEIIRLIRLIQNEIENKTMSRPTREELLYPIVTRGLKRKLKSLEKVLY